MEAKIEIKTNTTNDRNKNPESKWIRFQTFEFGNELI